MSVVEENWQTTRPTIRERSTFMFNNDLLSDVKFVVRGSNGESESIKKVIPAHKFVLSISSPVFLAMFYGELADTKDSVDLPDCEYEGLLELFRYMYSDEVNLSGSNVMQVLYLAKKYIVPSLADKCSEYLHKNLDASNVFCVLPNAQKYEEKNLVDRCWEVIDFQAEEAVKSDDFVTIESSLLEAIIGRETLRIKEVELFKAVDLWATKECERQGVKTDGEVKRNIIGERILKGIRFPVMEQKEFVAVVLDSDILTKREAFDLMKYFNSVLTSPLQFSETKRANCNFSLCRFCRFLSLNEGLLSQADVLHSLVFSADKEVMLHGLYLFASNKFNYRVSLKIKNTSTGFILVSKTGSYEKVSVQCEVGDYAGVHVLLDSPIMLQKGINYCIEASMNSSTVKYGTNGVKSLQCSGVTFTFHYYQVHNSIRGVGSGQFPEFLFTVK